MKTVKEHFHTFQPILAGLGVYILLTVLHGIAQIAYLHFALKSVTDVKIAAAVLSKSNPVMIAFTLWGYLSFFVAGFVAAKMSKSKEMLNAVITGVVISLTLVLTLISLTFIAIKTRVDPLDKRFPNNPEKVQVVRDQYNAVISNTVTKIPLTMTRSAFYALIGGGVYMILSQKKDQKPAKKKTKKN
jgi:hypothetical protein